MSRCKASVTGVELWARRKLLGVTQKELGREMGVSGDYIYRLERNGRRLTDDLVTKLERAEQML